MRDISFLFILKKLFQTETIFSMTEASPSGCLVSYPEHSLEESYSSAEIQSECSTAPADWARQTTHNNVYF